MRIAEHIPEDLVGVFRKVSRITKDDIHSIPPGPSGIVSAIDGSNTMVAEGGTVSIAAIRAVRTTFSGEDRFDHAPDARHHRAGSPEYRF